jgi:hypothetical protein
MKQLGLGLNLSTKKTRKREFHEVSCPPFFAFQGSMVSIET